MSDISIAEKARRQFEIEKEAENISAFIMASMLKLLAFQLNAIGELKPPPKKGPKLVLALARKKLDEFLKEVYDEPKEGDSPKGIIQNPTK
jgi:hypothetical protein